MIRGEVHNLVLFYVNRVVAQQVTFNRHMVSSVNRLTTVNEAQQRRIAHLEAQLRELQTQRGD